MKQHDMPMPLLGIMVTERPQEPPFANSSSYQRLCELGLKTRIEVFVFSPNRIDWNRQEIIGNTYNAKEKKWQRKYYPLPELIYDRCFFSTKAAYLNYRIQVRKLRTLPAVRFLGHGLEGKWEVLQLLRQDSYFHPFLPETTLLSRTKDVLDWLGEKGELFLKPRGGSQGKGVLYLKKLQGEDVVQVKGRDSRNRPFEKKFLSDLLLRHWLRGFVGNRSYLLQSYLTLHTAANTAYDIRSMVQKNGRGEWQTTGMGVRCGQTGSITSNLHGGGTALEVMPFLTREFGAAKAEELLESLNELSTRIPPVLEAGHGRLAELGIDLGIDRSGRIWILEVNSKPGRSIFTRMVNEQAHQIAIESPLHYAEYLLHKFRRVT
ncbi:YheC/YheD family endospore coat-associated protein [Paenibacillus eucommiae]|uniref:Glutathione synthase/RimK-type ligase-like ATP-grasp enzyme n=1 Tax=Paenibacillus eucommiae TaxID=1355755 RepID=A0ABS4J0C7_9BACL|nr:YheC/YheD family protein [Paenibacillus eucommiae]MBP1993275.1 glutathione synthase/RimK-type ligase-like ATP-grasp enzyme [Paenibacillus eucommiae]